MNFKKVKMGIFMGLTKGKTVNVYKKKREKSRKL